MSAEIKSPHISVATIFEEIYTNGVFVIYYLFISNFMPATVPTKTQIIQNITSQVMKQRKQ